MNLSISSILRRSRSTSALRSLNARNRASYNRGRFLRSGSLYKSRRSLYASTRSSRKSTRAYNRRKMKYSYSRYYRKRRYRQRGLTYSDPKVKLLKQGSASWLEYYRNQDKSSDVFNNLICWASWRSPRKVVDGIACLVAGRPYVKYISLSDADKLICTKMYGVLSIHIANKRVELMTPGFYQSQQIQAQATREIIKEQVQKAVRARVEKEIKTISLDVPDLHSSDSYRALQQALTVSVVGKRQVAAADLPDEAVSDVPMSTSEL